MDMDTENNIKVINKEYERVRENPDNMIMSESLRELIGRPDLESQASLSSADSHVLYLSSAGDAMDITELPGTLHTIRQLNDKMILSFEVANITQSVLKRLHGSMSNDQEINIKLNGAAGFSCDDTVLECWDFMKLAPHQFLLSLTFGGNNVVF
jgi:hypothetical protein